MASMGVAQVPTTYIQLKINLVSQYMGTSDTHDTD